MTKTKDPICRSFRQDFPQFVARAEALGVNIALDKRPRKGPARVFWLDDHAQLTGFGINTDGRLFTLDDAVQHIDRVLALIEKDRALVAKMSAPQRFLRVINELRKINPQYRTVAKVRHPNGDNGFVWFFAALDGAVYLMDIGKVAQAKADWRKGEILVAQHARFCNMLVQDFSRRRQEAK